jgi:hypothetical protein
LRILAIIAPLGKNRKKTDSLLSTNTRGYRQIIPWNPPVKIGAA